MSQSDENVLWERQEEEPNLWYDRFVSYLQMGPSRTLLGTANAEQVQKGSEPFNGTPGAWLNAFKQWNWKERAEAWDEHRRKQVFTQGNAYDVYRVEKLNKYSQRLETQIDKMLDDLEKKKTRKVWFNHFLYEKYLQSLEAIADETGGRIKTVKQEVTGKDGGPIQTVLCLPDNGDDDVIPPSIDEQEIHKND